MSPFFIRKQNESRGLFALKIAGVVLLGIIGIGALAILVRLHRNVALELAAARIIWL